MPILRKVFGMDFADTALDGLLEDLQQWYSNIPGLKLAHSSPSFKRYVVYLMHIIFTLSLIPHIFRSDIIFNVVGAGNKVHNFCTEALGLKTVADLHVLLQEDCYLSDKDFKDKSIIIRVDLYET